jgi:hypothetical protein
MKKLGLLLVLCMVIFPLPAQVYFTGNGGAGQSLTILAPDGKNLGSADVNLPDLVLSTISGDFSNRKFSNIETVDWQSRKAVWADNEQPVYKEDSSVATVGEVLHTQYKLVGVLTKIDSRYRLDLTITDTRTTINKATHRGTYSRELLVYMSGA